MATHISARDARDAFAEVTARVKYTGEPAIITKRGKPFVVVVRPEDVEELELLRARMRLAELDRLAARAAVEDERPDMTDEEIVKQMRAVRTELYRERYGGP